MFNHQLIDLATTLSQIQTRQLALTPDRDLAIFVVGYHTALADLLTAMGEDGEANKLKRKIDRLAAGHGGARMEVTRE